MTPLEDTKQFDEETLAVRWVTQEEAAALIALTEKNGRRKRDLQVLETAFELFRTREARGEEEAGWHVLHAPAVAPI